MKSKTKDPSHSSSLQFIIHKHAASHLHYDFRLEIKGVLKSWAIPKGPSLNPNHKRLAIEVEDHTLSYGLFEGVIPPGCYGAGTVMIWDRGIYREATSHSVFESETLRQEGLHKGAIRFILEGQKLKGEFSLIRMKEKQWLLIKKADLHASETDILLQERSVYSNKTLEEIG